MIQVDYGSLLSPEPIPFMLGIKGQKCDIKAPTLRDICKVGFDTFYLFQLYLKITPEEHFLQYEESTGERKTWDDLTDLDKWNYTMFDCIQLSPILQNIYSEVFNFFFTDTVTYQDGLFIVTNCEKVDDEIKPGSVIGVINHNIFDDLVSILQQICCIEPNKKETKPIFKNEKARRNYLKTHKLRKRKKSKIDRDLTIPNIISAVATASNNLNMVTIWDLTIFQLFDVFDRLRTFDIYSMNRTSVSVWGEGDKAKFDNTIWYRNTYDSKSSEPKSDDLSFIHKEENT